MATAKDLEVARRRAALLKIFLVVLLRAVKWPGCRDLRRDRPLELPARVQLGLHLLRGGFLLRRMKENRRAILRPEVGPLSIDLRRIVYAPEHLEQSLKTDLRRIERNLHDLSVPGLVGANILVRRILRSSAAVARNRFDYSRHFAERGLDAPEAPGAECGNLCCHLFLLLRPVRRQAI